VCIFLQIITYTRLKVTVIYFISLTDPSFTGTKIQIILIQISFLNLPKVS
jgi:hypothetical protein